MTGDCADCKHSAAYHDGAHGNPGRPCRAWDPEASDWMCACNGWKQGAAVVLNPVEPRPDKYWTD